MNEYIGIILPQHAESITYIIIVLRIVDVEHNIVTKKVELVMHLGPYAWRTYRPI